VAVPHCGALRFSVGEISWVSVWVVAVPHCGALRFSSGEISLVSVCLSGCVSDGSSLRSSEVLEW